VSAITFGTRFGALDGEIDNNELFTFIDRRTIYSTFTGFWPWIHPWIYPQLVKRTRYGFIYIFCAHHIASIKTAIKTGQATSKIEAEPFIARLIRSDPQKIKMEDIFTTTLSNVFASSDTTATSLCGVLYHLLRNPRVLAKLCKEIDEADIRVPLVLRRRKQCRICRRV
jgi:hypothetical protein